MSVSITSIASVDLISDSRAVLNTNLSNLKAAVESLQRLSRPALGDPNGPTFTEISTGAVSTANGLRTLSAAFDDGCYMNVVSVSAPYSLTVLCAMPTMHEPYRSGGICLRDSLTGAHIRFGYAFDSNVEGAYMVTGDQYDAEGVLGEHSNSDINPRYFGGPITLRLADDGTDRKFFVSYDGYTFLEATSSGNTDFIPGDQVGVYCESANEADLTHYLTVYGWELV